jgi:multidrug efflux pump subunit AcrA (membrane-fusion protein)
MQDFRHEKRMLLAIGILVVLLMLWMGLAKIDVVAHAEGKVIPSEFSKIVQNLEGGVIAEINIRQGQRVQTGELLLRLNSIQYSSDLESTKKQINALIARRARLEAEIKEKPIQFPDNLINGAKDIVQAESLEYQLRREKLNQLRKFVELAEKEYQLIVRLNKEGLEPNAEVIRAERGLTERRQMFNDFKETTASELGRVANEFRAKEDSLISLGDKVNRTDVISPVDGIVGRVFVTTNGGVVKPGEPIAEIIPLDDELVIEAKLKPSDVAFVYPGMLAKIKITAYDYAIYGSFNGKIRSVSPDAVTNEKGESHYIVRVVSEDKKREQDGKPLVIIPGMMTQVDIVTEQRTFLQYLLKPFEQISTNSFKER